MIPAIIRWSAEHRFVVLGVAIVLLAVAWHSMRTMPLDALPDLADTQVIVYSKWDRSPDLVEDQVTYPITTALLGAPKVKAVRGFSDFGYSFVYVVFEDGTDVYWARSRVLEYLSKIQAQLPQGVKTELGPDASSLGWVFQYALVDRTGKHSSDELRSYQDWFLRYALQSVPGVAEVATVGGQVRQYQVNVNPNALAAHGLTLESVIAAVRQGNNDAGGRLVELSGREYMVRGRGYVKRTADLEQLALGSDNGTPVTVKDVATVSLGPELRRGVTDLDGEGDVTGGIVVMRQGENALQVIGAVKHKLDELKPSMPAGVEVVTTYDRSELITQAIGTVESKLWEEILIVCLILLVFLWHFPSSVVPIITLPVSVALTFIPMKLLGLNANLLSLSGIAISIGVLVDGAIVEVENAYNRIHKWQQAGRPGNFHQVRLAALLEVGPSVFFSLLVIAAAFIPIFTLVDQEGRLFRPLAASKNLAMAIAALLAITLDPALRMLFARAEPFTFKPRWLASLATTALVGRYRAEEEHPVSKLLHRLYEGPCRFVLRHPWAVVASAGALVAATVPLYFSLGHEFMPPLREGTLLYMPSSVEPGMSAAQAQQVLQVQDKILRAVPEVDHVFGKAGRANTSTDSAPLSMFETTITLKPREQWRPGLTEERLIDELNQKVSLPGLSNAWTMPIKGRLDMLSTGVRTPVGIKVTGAELPVIEKLAQQTEAAVRKVSGTRSVYAERVSGGWFLDFDLRRDQLARYGLSVDDANQLVMTAIGGDVQSVSVEGRERYGISVRYARDFREDPEALKRVLVPLKGGGQIPLEQLADVKLTQGPAMIRDENGLLAGYVYVDFDPSKTDLGAYVDNLKQAVAASVKPPPGYALTFSGQYENLLRVSERLKLIVPLTLALIALLLWLNTRSAFKTAVVMLAVPFSALGALLLLKLLGINLSIAVWVGLIALMGLDAETGVFMLMFLDLSVAESKANGTLRTGAQLVEAIIHGAVKRVRPKAMTVCAAMLGLLPIMWSQGTGADLMKPIAAPMVGGLATSFLLELLVYPALYLLWMRRKLGMPAEVAAGDIGATAVAAVQPSAR
ncbi:MAG: CusA/CzcA family heavy metal efflux RND transporter [Myxococcaceae bacterium]